ncbi:hypothetical protein DRQ25_10120 [Candidatus Fermentibacteria bacterium]|nr:MAG: hypothetical protein DRQ25_10120 [Candidatus Fermentibacteria bacterium]
MDSYGDVLGINVYSDNRNNSFLLPDPLTELTELQLKQLGGGTRFGADLNHSPTVTALWMYVQARQGARRMKRIGILG